MKCKICGGVLRLFDTAVIIGKYNIKYYECHDCGFVQTEEPYWLSEVYSSAITSSDIGLISRNITISQNLDILIRLYFKKCIKFLDYGGGYGILVRMMRDKGYDFEWCDEYCENLFAQTHERKRDFYDVVTSFEMLEHLENPFETLDIIFNLGDTIVFKTELIPDNRPKVKDWWYYCTDHGQHISFYTDKAMRYIACKYNRYYYHVAGLHIFTKTRVNISPLPFKIIRKIPCLEKLVPNKRHSLLFSDYEKLTGRSIV